jgi:hypothetical protein
MSHWNSSSRRGSRTSEIATSPRSRRSCSCSACARRACQCSTSATPASACAGVAGARDEAIERGVRGALLLGDARRVVDALADVLHAARHGDARRVLGVLRRRVALDLGQQQRQAHQAHGRRRQDRLEVLAEARLELELAGAVARRGIVADVARHGVAGARRRRDRRLLQVGAHAVDAVHALELVGERLEDGRDAQRGANLVELRQRRRRELHRLLRIARVDKLLEPRA